MKKTRKISMLLAVTLLCVMTQVAQQLSRGRWDARWKMLIDQADTLQSAFDTCRANPSSAGKMQELQRELDLLMKDILASSQPNPSLYWIQGITSVGLLCAVIALWWTILRKNNNEPEN